MTVLDGAAFQEVIVVPSDWALAHVTHAAVLKIWVSPGPQALQLFICCTADDYFFCEACTGIEGPCACLASIFAELEVQVPL